MESFFSRYKNALVLLIVLLIQVVALAVQVRRPLPGAAETGQIRAIRYGVVSLIAPPERWIHAMGGGLRRAWSNYAYLRGVRRQNRELKAEVDRLRIEQAGLLDDAHQGQRLQHLLSFKQHYIYTTQPAQVIGTSGSDNSHVLYLDKGSREGIRPDMPVITPDGIVGKIKDVFPHSAQLLVISDQTSGAGVVLETSRIRGVLRGNSLGQTEIVNIAPDEQIKPGERILTSGGDGVYPRGLPVGVVTGTVPDAEHDGYIAVVVKTAANLARLEEVLVVTSVSDQMPAMEQHDITQSAIEAGAQKRAAEILSERLPGLKDPNAPAAAPGAVAVPADGDPGRPPRPGLALHTDRFSPGTTRSASTLIPGQPSGPGSSASGGTSTSSGAPTSGAGRTAIGQPLAPARVPAPSATGAGAKAGALGIAVPGSPRQPGAGSAGSRTSSTGVSASPKATTGEAGIPGATRPRAVPGLPGGSVRPSPSQATTPGSILPKKPLLVPPDGSSPQQVQAKPFKPPASPASTTVQTAPPRKPQLVPPDGSMPQPVQAKPIQRSTSPAGTTVQTAPPRKPRAVLPDGSIPPLVQAKPVKPSPLPTSNTVRTAIPKKPTLDLPGGGNTLPVQSKPLKPKPVQPSLQPQAAPPGGRL